MNATIPAPTRRRTTSTFGLFAVMMLLASPAAAIEPLLENAQWSPGEDGLLPAGWRVNDQGQGVRLDDQEKPPGTAGSLRVDIREVRPSWGEVTQSLRGLKPDVSYRLSGMVKSSLARLGLLQVKLYKDDRELKRISSTRSTTEWSRIEQEFSTEGADRVEILCRWTPDKPEAVGQSVWFAGLELVELGVPRLVAAEAVGTFHSLGLTATYQGGANRNHICRVRYRAEGETDWRAGMDMVLCPADKQFRGSLFQLQPDQRYAVQCELVVADRDQVLSTVATAGRTWSEQTPIAEVRRLPARSDTPLIINAQGRPDGWILYAAAEDATATIDVGRSADHAVTIENAAYVILQNVVLRGGTRDCVRLAKSHHIRVRRCDIAGWGDPGERREGLEQGLYVDSRGRVINFQAGVRVSAGSSQVVVEDNYIHHPRGTANSWQFGHPAGPQGVILDQTDGNNVVRNNDMIGAEEHWWNDAIESIRNSDRNGGPYRDSDIYGNVLAFSNDDGTELDGGQINVRYWNNWIDKALCGVSCAPNRCGPSYVFRNLIVLTGDEHFRTGAGFKMGGNRFPDPGLSLLLHNTVYSDRFGLTAGHYGLEPTPIRTRNNLFTGPRLGCGAIRYRHPEDGDFDFDLLPPAGLQVAAPQHTTHAVFGEPALLDPTAGDFRLQSDSLAIDVGTMLPGVNDGFVGKGPDLGAFESGPKTGPVFPVREHAFTVMPLRAELAFLPGDATTAGQFTVELPSAAGSRWTARPSSPWLRCTPETGAASDRPQVVRVTMTDSPHPLRLHRGAITFRTDSGLNRSVMVEMRVYPAHCVALPFEAEAGEVTGGMRRVNDPAASGGVYLDTPEGAAGQVVFTVDIPADGTYYLVGRTCVPGPPENAPQQDSFDISVDDGDRLRWDLPNEAPDRWVTNLAQAQYGGGGRHGFRLVAGRHKLTVFSRERLARLDRVVVTNAPYVTPPDGS